VWFTQTALVVNDPKLEVHLNNTCIIRSIFTENTLHLHYKYQLFR
jgi:hypothetical protein